jgi:hypothetical protein
MRAARNAGRTQVTGGEGEPDDRVRSVDAEVEASHAREGVLPYA